MPDLSGNAHPKQRRVARQRPFPAATPATGRPSPASGCTRPTAARPLCDLCVATLPARRPREPALRARARQRAAPGRRAPRRLSAADIESPPRCARSRSTRSSPLLARTVFDFVADLSLRPSFADHYLKDYRLARANPVGKGAAARFLLDTPVFNERGEIAIVECDRPRRIVEEGRVGRRRPLAAAGRLRLHPRGGRLHPRRADHASASPKTASTGAQTGVHVGAAPDQEGARAAAAHLRGARRSRARRAPPSPATSRQGAALRRPRPGRAESARGRRVDCPPRWPRSASEASSRHAPWRSCAGGG